MDFKSKKPGNTSIMLQNISELDPDKIHSLIQNHISPLFKTVSLIGSKKSVTDYQVLNYNLNVI
jgi:hypothetical protein